MQVAQVFNKEIILKNVDSIKLNGMKGAILKVTGCGLCGSDIVKFREGIAKNGTVLGHEVVGIIEEINSDTSFNVGDKIVTSHHIPCFECTYCVHGNYSMCSHFKETNIFPGGFSQKIFVSEEHLKNVAYKVPENISDEEISFYEPLACCIRAINRCYLRPTDTVLVIGLGSIGLLMAEALKAKGHKVYGCDILEERIIRANIRKIESYDTTNLEMFDAILRYKTQSQGIDAIFMTSGADKALEVALKTIKLGGKISVFSSTPQNMGYANNEIYYKELTVMGSYSPSPKDLEESFNLITTKKVNVSGLTTGYDLKDIAQAFDDTISNKVLKAFIRIPQDYISIQRTKITEEFNKVKAFASIPKPLPTVYKYNINNSLEKHECIATDEEYEKQCLEVYDVKKSKFHLPMKNSDLIQSAIFNSKKYWDMPIFEKTDSILKDNAVILDIGANIGNHTLYWANERNAKKIYAFEPYPYSYKTLEKNISIWALRY